MYSRLCAAIPALGIAIENIGANAQNANRVGERQLESEHARFVSVFDRLMSISVQFDQKTLLD